MNLFPPDPHIELYEEGFGADDPFNRTDTGKSLSDLVDRIEDPLVIALDGGWGSGKTWFLKRWVGAHHHENEGRATTVYFDAFAHDFMDEPLIALTAAITDRLPKCGEGSPWKKFRAAAVTLSRPALRIGLAAVTSGVSEMTGPVTSAALATTQKEVEAFWTREDGKRAAMDQFRQTLTDLTTPGDGESAPLVVVIDELDRCRPDYALALLEVIKHFFSVPHVHFVLGVNLDALEHSVRARYGNGIDARRYLRKFVSVTLNLPRTTKNYDKQSVVLEYFEHQSGVMKISPTAIKCFSEHLRMLIRTHELSMRDMNQLLARIALIRQKNFEDNYLGWSHIAASMVLFRLVNPETEKKALDGSLTIEEVRKFYGIKTEVLSSENNHGYDHYACYISGCWEYVITNGAKPTADRDVFSNAFGFHSTNNYSQLPQKVHDKYLSQFKLLQGS